MSDVQRTIDQFGSVKKTAEAIGAPTQTVYSWKKRGSIPHWWQQIIDRQLEADQPTSLPR